MTLSLRLLFLGVLLVLITCAAIVVAEELVIDNTQPVILVLRPTTASPNFTNQTGQDMEVAFRYSETNPANYSVNISNSTATICYRFVGSGITGGSNISVVTSCTIGASANDGTYSLIVRMTDVVDNISANTQTGAVVIDRTPPVRSAPVPANNSVVSTSPITLGVTTSEVATCRFSITPDVPYGSMAFTFANTQSTAHSSFVELTEFGTYLFYVRCRDNAGNANGEDFLIVVTYSPSTLSFGRSVTWNLAFAIGENASSNSLAISTTHASSADVGVVVGLAASGTQSFLGKLNATYSPSAKLIGLTQSADRNRFLLAVTTGTHTHISQKSKTLGGGRLVPGAFGTVTAAAPATYPVYLVASYEDIDIANTTAFSGAGTLMIRNQGRTPGGISTVLVEPS